MTAFSFGRVAAAAGVALVLAVGPTVAAEKDAAKPAAKDPVVATVNGKKITLSDLKALHAQLPKRYQAIPMARLYKPLLETKIRNEILSEAGRKAGLAKDAEVMKRVDEYRDRVVREMYLERVVDKKIDEAALKAAYDEYVKSYKGAEEIRARHVLVKDKKAAMAVIEALEKGEKFADLATKNSIGPSKSRGGDLGWFSRKQMVKPFAEAAFKLKKGEHSSTPVKTQFGWHVIQVTDKRTKPAPKFDAMKAQLRTQLGRKIAVAELKRLQDDAKVERFKMDGTPEAAKTAPAPKDADKTEKK